MSHDHYFIDVKATFGKVIQLPQGVDDSYLLRFSTPILMISSGISFVNSYRDFVFRLLPNKNSAYANYYSTNKFLNYLFYLLRIRDIKNVKYEHIQAYMKHMMGENSDFRDLPAFCFIRLMFGKFRHDGLIEDIPYPLVENTIGQMRLNTPRKSQVVTQPFERQSQHEVFESIDSHLSAAKGSNIYEFRANALIAFLLYTDLKVGEALNLRFSNLYEDKVGKKYIRYQKRNEETLVKLCNKANLHLDAYLGVFEKIYEHLPLFQKITRSKLPAQRGLKVASARIIVHDFCDRNGMVKVTPSSITKARRYVSVKEFMAMKLFE